MKKSKFSDQQIAFALGAPHSRGTRLGQGKRLVRGPRVDFFFYATLICIPTIT
ncbi:hypothetical protein HNQ36_002900 [Afipia massiliensis]|jgi:hypothetical protein|uniref:Uncharacterized protein n=1 Tax=Afipia massiliensis TaxID=211460 RepID=A0A840MX73_9BRAD|nr:hypothetical protein [Afipia massiliensis]